MVRQLKQWGGHWEMEAVFQHCPLSLAWDFSKPRRHAYSFHVVSSFHSADSIFLKVPSWLWGCGWFQLGFNVHHLGPPCPGTPGKQVG